MAVRAIDAIELQQKMCALCNQDYSDEPCEPSDCVFIRAINETPTLTPPNEWVSVENALPEECADILLCRKILKIPEIGTYQQARFWVYDEIGDVYQVDDVTHWLPIPTPYDIEHIHISEPPEG